MGSEFIQVDKLDLKKLAKKNAIARTLCNYLIYVEHNPKKALELAAEASILSNYND
jgi:tetratricopeptide repeat protein 8